MFQRLFLLLEVRNMKLEVRRGNGWDYVSMLITQYQLPINTTEEYISRSNIYEWIFDFAKILKLI
jgi:hypothetical protein